MSELQAILARRRKLNRENSEEDSPTHVQAPYSAVEAHLSSPETNAQSEVDASGPQPSDEERAPTPPPSPPKQAKATPQTPPRIANDLQAKLRERRMKAAAVYGKHVKSDFGDSPDKRVNNDVHVSNNQSVGGAAANGQQTNNGYSRQQSVPPRKSTFFPRSTPLAPKSPVNTSVFNPGANSISQNHARKSYEVPNSPGGSSVASHRKVFEVPNSPGSSVGEAIKSIEKSTGSENATTRRSLENATPSSPARKQAGGGEPKSPSMLDLMAERYKEQKLLRQKNLEQQQSQPHVEKKQQQQQQQEVKPITYYRSGTRPPSSQKSYPTSPGSITSGASSVPSSIPAPRVNANNQYNKPHTNKVERSSISSVVSSDAPSESSVVDGSVFSETDNIPEFMRMKLKKTKEQNAEARLIRAEAELTKPMEQKAHEDRTDDLKPDPPVRTWQPKTVDKDPPVMKRWQPPAKTNALSNRVSDRNAIAEGVTWTKQQEQQNEKAAVQEEKPLGVPSFDSVPQEESSSFDENAHDTIDELPNQNNMPMFANYDTAVLAAKEAIDASNRSRSRNIKSDLDVGDPGLTLEPSPQSSLDGTEGEKVNVEINDRQNIAASNNPFGTSFVNSSLDMFANSDDEKENKDVGGSLEDDGFGFAPTPFFGSDPFDPFIDGEKAQTGNAFDDTTKQNNNVGEEDILIANSSEESPHFDAQFQDDFGSDGVADLVKEEKEEPHDKIKSFADKSSDSAESDVDEAPESPHQSRDIAPTSVADESLDNSSANLSRDVAQTSVANESLVISGDENDLQHLVTEDAEYEEEDELIFDDNHATFTAHPLNIKFAAPNDLHRVASPTQNPLTGNPIICRYYGGEFVIEEIDTTPTQSPTTLMSACVVSNELSTKLSRTFGATTSLNVIGTSSVLSLAAGVHRVHGHKRVRVSALIEVAVSSLDAGLKLIRVVAVWRWGYNSGRGSLVALQSVLSTSGIDDETIDYDPKTLQVADGLLFLGGHKTLSHDVIEPTVFVAKPAVRDGWVSVRVEIGNKGSSVSSVAAINDANTWIAAGYTDGRVSVWNYEIAARTNRLAQNLGRNGQPMSLLQRVCSMNGDSDVTILSDHDCLENYTNASPTSKLQASHYTCLSWVQPCSSGISTLPLLAAAFRSGVAIYHVSGSIEAEPHLLAPLAKARYSTAKNQAHEARISWFDLGPRSPPCLCFIQSDGNTTKLNLCALDIPWYGSSEIVESSSTQVHRSIGIVSQIKCDHAANDTSILPQRGAIGCFYRDGSAFIYQPSLSVLPSSIAAVNVMDEYFSSLCRPIASQSLGLTTGGNIYFDESATSVKSQYEDTILTVFTTTQCSKVLNSNPSSIEFSHPSQRNWLLMSAPGDAPVGSLIQDDLDDDNFNVSYRREAERGGSVSDVVCELTCGENSVSGLMPQRIVREDGGRRAAIMFASSYFGGNVGSDLSKPRRRTHVRLSTDPVAYALLDIDEAMKHRSSASFFTLRHARDVAFLPTFQMEGGFYCSSVIVLDPDGTGLSITTVISSRVKDGMTEKVIESEDKCLLHHEGIEGRRVFVLLNNGRPQLLLAGNSTVVGRPCIIVAQHELEHDSYSNTYSLIESDSLGHRLWLAAGEEIISVRELPKHPNAVRALIAAATQERVIILAVDEESLSIVSEVKANLTCPSLSPLGSHCVAFCAKLGGGESSVMYLSCLQSSCRYGVIKSFPSTGISQTNVIMEALRPDRVIISSSHGNLRLVDNTGAEDKFQMPIPTSYPILLLEPLIANALCQDEVYGKDASSNELVQQSLCQVIEKFGRKETSLPHGDNEGIGCSGAGITSKVYRMLAEHECHQAASLLLAGNRGHIGANAKLVPQWATISAKLSATIDSDLTLRVLSGGITKQSSPVRLNKEIESLIFNGAKNGSNAEVLRMLDFGGSQISDDVLMQMILSLDNPTLLSELHNTEDIPSDNSIRTYPQLLSGLTRTATQAFHLAPSLQHNAPKDVRRESLINKEVLERAMPKQSIANNSDLSIREGQCIWTAGPFDKKEKLLCLDTLEDWFGRCLPKVLGSEGVAIAAETGEQTLKDILSVAALEETMISTDQEHDNIANAGRKNWIERIGDEHLDEDNLSLYLRFSEGTDEDNNYAQDGFSDLSRHGHKCVLHGSQFASLEATTSSADEGEEGKVHLLHDLVFNQGAPRDEPTGVATVVSRGDSLDIGMLHTSRYKSRQRCTIEFLYYLPQSNLVADEIILARRSLFFDDNEDTSHLCLPDEKHNTLWELALLPTGLLELRTGAGSVVSSALAIEVDEASASNGIVSWGGWNHVCLLFSAQASSVPTEFSASILMNGSLVVDSVQMFVNPVEAELPRFINDDDLEEAMEKSILAFGIGPSIGFRITEIRVWACLRDKEDVKLMMYEHLRDAEMKKKLKVNIRKGLKKNPGLLAPQADNRRIDPISPPSQPIITSKDFVPDFANFSDIQEQSTTNPSVSVEQSVQFHERADPPADPSFTVTISDSLSSKLKKSASTAIIRGPPASRHFGGNRGGLLLGDGRQGVGPIAICGSDKSIVFYHDLDPPAKTYPIGASGAVLSDVIDDSGSEYMACFLAKEKRMVVFELALKAVVVELQMKTKLNFWRYLPPEADGGDLVFMLITPIGGFHWKPLDESPRPRQVWSRGTELESKKILTYEEGGSCLGNDQSARSSVALVLASHGTSDATVEAFCISLERETSRLCISSNVFGAALFHSTQSSGIKALPCVAYVVQDEMSQLLLNIQELIVTGEAPNENTLSLGATIDSVHLDVDDTKSYDAPPLSMGTSPEALCCCHKGFIVAVMRKNGLVFAYYLTNGTLSIIGRIDIGHFVVDAAIRSGSADHEVELVLLLAETSDVKDGRIASIMLSRE
ncbi:hypothetical protein ACHAWO_008198 [Cyclotella atomus]|uniref:Uncharacterized protein n=1 Tax=Cyclotella atomus TaxID=382360 RepID=A0ABD3NXT7_9STRA